MSNAGETLPGAAESPRPEAARDREARLTAVLNGIWSGFYAVDRQWRLTLFNDFCEQFFGVSRDQVLGRVLWDVMPNVAGSMSDREFRRAMDRQEPVEFEGGSAARPDRELRWRIFPVSEGLAVSIEDVTERRRAERALRENEARLRALADNLPSGMVYQMEMRRDGSERRFV